jgi:hypothetical protein
MKKVIENSHAIKVKLGRSYSRTAAASERVSAVAWL